MISCLKIQIVQLYKWLKKLFGQLVSCDEKAQDVIKTKCSENFFFWYEFFVCSISNKDSKIRTYKLFEPYQINYITQLIRSIDSGSDLLVEKSINMKATTMTALVFLWYWLYKDNSHLMILTKNTQGLKDIFKIYKEILKYLPPGVIDEEIAWQFKHKKDTISKIRLVKKPRQMAILKNPLNGNVMYIVSSYKRVFPVHSKKFKAVLYDDYAFQRFQQPHWHSFEGRASARIGISCPNGSVNFFYELISTDIKIHRLHWVQKNQTDKEWYRAQTDGLEPVFVEQYFNINYSVRQVTKRATKAACKAEGQLEEAITSERQQPRPERSRPRRKTFTSWASRSEAPVEKVSRRKRHMNPENFTSAQTYEQVKSSVKELQDLASENSEQAVEFKNQCFCSLSIAFEILAALTGIVIEASVYRAEKECVYVQVQTTEHNLRQIPYDAQISQQRFRLL